MEVAKNVAMSVGGIAVTGVSVLVACQQTLATTARAVKADVNEKLESMEKNMLREIGHVRSDMARLESKMDARATRLESKWEAQAARLESKLDAQAAKSDLLCAAVLLGGLFFWQSSKRT